MAKTIAELRKELAAREEQVSKLRDEREKIAGRLAALDEEIAAVSGTAVKKAPKAAKKATKKASARKGPAKTKSSLADVLAEVLVGKGKVKVAEAGKLALSTGYKSASSQFRNIVSQTLSADKRFKNISRGVYVLKGEGKGTAKKVAKKAVEKAKRPVGRAVTKPLSQYLVEALKKADMPSRAAQLSDAVLKAGYVTKDKNFKQTEASTLGSDKRFQRVRRGVYKLA